VKEVLKLTCRSQKCYWNDVFQRGTNLCLWSLSFLKSLYWDSLVGITVFGSFRVICEMIEFAGVAHLSWGGETNSIWHLDHSMLRWLLSMWGPEWCGFIGVWKPLRVTLANDLKGVSLVSSRFGMIVLTRTLRPRLSFSLSFGCCEILCQNVLVPDFGTKAPLIRFRWYKVCFGESLWETDVTFGKKLIRNLWTFDSSLSFQLVLALLAHFFREPYCLWIMFIVSNIWKTKFMGSYLAVFFLPLSEVRLYCHEMVKEANFGSSVEQKMWLIFVISHWLQWLQQVPAVLAHSFGVSYYLWIMFIFSCIWKTKFMGS